MRIAVINEIRDDEITQNVTDAIVHALNEQQRDAAAMHQREPIEVYRADGLSLIDTNDCPLALLLDADQAGMLGYHYALTSGRPAGVVFWGPVKVNGGAPLLGPDAFSVTASHEALEVSFNPYATLWSDRPDGDEEPFELCDRTQGDGYAIGDVWVSNFLGPRAFSEGPGPYDRQRLLKSPREVRPGAYVTRRSGGPTGTISNDFGERFPEWKRALLGNLYYSRAGRRDRVHLER